MLLGSVVRDLRKDEPIVFAMFLKGGIRIQNLMRSIPKQAVQGNPESIGSAWWSLGDQKYIPV